MFTVNYKYEDKQIQIKFADLHDAFAAARALLDNGYKASVSNEENPDGVYMIPKNI